MANSIRNASLAALFLLIPGVVIAGERVPHVTFRHSAEFNSECKITVQRSWTEEAKAKETLFTALWEGDAPSLFNFFFSHLNGAFSQSSYLAKLSACPSTISYSRPLVLNISRFLESYVGPSAVNPNHAFIVLAFHELMHNWVEDNLRDSALLKKYSDESRDVKVHLHLMAIEHFVYHGLGRRDLLGWIEMKYPAIGGDYARAWEIVRNEGDEAFLREF
ncbi:MAG: hypothetical protein NDJ90_08620 [Oligoflexia bacterium]|nr:hypothetical protein [Oligoflexia bacterium]